MVKYREGKIKHDFKTHIPTLTYTLKGRNTSSGQSRSQNSRPKSYPPIPTTHTPPTLQSHPPGLTAVYLIHTAKSLSLPQLYKKTKQITYFL